MRFSAPLFLLIMGGTVVLTGCASPCTKCLDLIGDYTMTVAPNSGTTACPYESKGFTATVHLSQVESSITLQLDGEQAEGTLMSDNSIDFSPFLGGESEDGHPVMLTISGHFADGAAFFGNADARVQDTCDVFTTVTMVRSTTTSSTTGSGMGN